MSLSLQFTIYNISSQSPLTRGYNTLDISLKCICLCKDNAASKGKAITKSEWMNLENSVYSQNK